MPGEWVCPDCPGTARIATGFGVHGQYLFVDAERLVVANVSSQELPLDAAHNRDIAGRIGGTARPGWLAFAPNGGPRVRIHLPPAASPLRTPVGALLPADTRCRVVR